MSSETPLASLLARVDALRAQLVVWAGRRSPWEPLTICREAVTRQLARIEQLQDRLTAPIVVATFGGTGTGKSALVNALVGADVTTSGRQRPTTTQAILVAHPDVRIDQLGFASADDVRVVRLDLPILRDIVLLDCPDPDTSESETPEGNLARLHRLLPHCDVLLYVSTQQKYRSARVTAELAEAAKGCRVVFVQTFADLDSDIRDDWRTQLGQEFAQSEIFFVDTQRALREQQAGRSPMGDFERLRDLLRREFHSSRRLQIRKTNLLDLVEATLSQCQEQVRLASPALANLRTALAEQQQRQIARLSTLVLDELRAHSQVWERRLLGLLAEKWGYSPFSLLVRLATHLGGWLTSLGMWRARSTAQLALFGAMQGARWLAEKQQESQAEERLSRAGTIWLDDASLRETQLVLGGYVRDARLDASLLEATDLTQLRRDARLVEHDVVGDMADRVDKRIVDISLQPAHHFIRWGYELAFSAMLLYVFGRPAWNFFYTNPWRGEPLMSSDFYIHGAVFLTLWGAFLVLLFKSRIHRALLRHLGLLANDLARAQSRSPLSPRLDETCRQIDTEVAELTHLADTARRLKQDLALTTP